MPQRPSHHPREPPNISPNPPSHIFFTTHASSLPRLRILRVATAADAEDDRGFERTRLLLGMLDVLARLGNLQARVERLADGWVGR
jgi:hypothetical protein